MKGIQKARKFKVALIFVLSFTFAIVAVLSAIVGVSFWANQKFSETFYSVSCLKVNNKIRILQISDLHDCTYGEGNATLIDRVEKLKPDIILLTGDSVSDDGEVDSLLALCSALAEIAPSYYIYGNHEVQQYYSYPLTQESLDEQFGFDEETRDPQKLLSVFDPFAARLTEAGVTVLKNRAVTVTVGDTFVDIYGVLTSNPSAFWSYAGESFNEFLYTDETHFKITAIHEPQIFEEFKPEYWGDIMLAGHTHGGMVKIPMLGALYTVEGGLFPARAGHYVYGRYEVQGRPLIVSSGLENQSIFRINNEPELVIVDVNKF